jgi:hypothetical protein
MDLLYTYLSGVEFRQKVQAVVEGFVALQKQVAKERRAMEVQWKLREKLIERVLSNTAGFYGDLQGIIGQSVIGPISELEMEDPDAEPLQLTDEGTPNAEPENCGDLPRLKPTENSRASENHATRTPDGETHP